jgi:hypothetical protein
MYDLFTVGDQASLHILSLLSTLCSPGEITNKAFQDTALPIIFPDPDNLSGMGIEISHGQVLSALFSTRHVINTSLDWQVMIRSDLQLKDIAVPISEKRIALEDEINCLLDVFSKYNANQDTILDDDECKTLLEDLGLGGAALSAELEALKGTDLCGFICWWWDRRKLYFSTSSTILNTGNPYIFIL